MPGWTGTPAAGSRRRPRSTIATTRSASSMPCTSPRRGSRLSTPTTPRTALHHVRWRGNQRANDAQRAGAGLCGGCRLAGGGAAVCRRFCHAAGAARSRRWAGDPARHAKLAEIAAALDTAPEVSVQISLPRWDHKSSFDLRKVFESLGLAKTLATTEDFDAIQSGLTITQAAQAANITVAEKGTVAAAVTQINGGRDRRAAGAGPDHRFRPAVPLPDRPRRNRAAALHGEGLRPALTGGRRVQFAGSSPVRRKLRVELETPANRD